jgi:hypothetical protein
MGDVVKSSFTDSVVKFWASEEEEKEVRTHSLLSTSLSVLTLSHFSSLSRTDWEKE